MPIQDIYGRQFDFGGAFSSDATTLTFPGLLNGGSAKGFLIQNVDINYSQPINKLFELGSPNVYYMAGPASGACRISRMIGEKDLTITFLQQFGNACAINATSNTIDIGMSGGCRRGLAQTTTKGVNVRAHFCLVRDFTIGFQINTALVTNGIVFEIGALNLYKTIPPGFGLPPGNNPGQNVQNIV